jgi:hypothetical protein
MQLTYKGKFSQAEKPLKKFQEYQNESRMTVTGADQSFYIDFSLSNLIVIRKELVSWIRIQIQVY